jgi:tetratricopeptide (TPR) repeat protein
VIKRIIYGLLLCISFSGYTQNDSIVKSDSLVQLYAVQKNRKELQEEQRALNFEKFFFQALSEKAINNYDKAIVALEKCQNIRPNDVAVNFEFSKNYYAQEKYLEAIAYAEKALEGHPENIFLLEHVKNIYVAEKNYQKALDVQQQIVVLKPSQQEDLIILYIRNNQIEDAKNLLIDLEKRGMLSDNLIQFKQSLLPNPKLNAVSNKIVKPINEQTVEELKELYLKNRSFTILREILTKQFSNKNYIDLEAQSSQGLELFPSQPAVYLMHARALNRLKEYSKAITTLKNGIDYVIEDYSIEAHFYEELSLAHKGLGMNVESSKYYNLALETRKKISQ